MVSLGRTNRTLVGRWWWTVDRTTLGLLIALMGIGVVLLMGAAPAAGGRIGLEGFYLFGRQAIFIPTAIILMIGISLLDTMSVRRLAIVGMGVTLILMVATLLVGPEVKGAQRWLPIAGFSLQPSEFLKPFFAVTSAWLFTLQARGSAPGNWISIGVFTISVALLLGQPDLGQTVVLGSIWGAQFFVSGLSVILVGGILVSLLAIVVGAYFLLPHVTERINNFIDGSAGSNYQVKKSLEAFQSGGLFGRGPGEGVVKSSLPDVHSDFIFAVAGEEFGALFCVLIVGLFVWIVCRCFMRLLECESLFAMVAGTGLVVQFAVQALINMASTLHLIPTKGMTLPFVSYGGSSMLSMAIAMGMLLSFTREGSAHEEVPRGQ